MFVNYLWGIKLNGHAFEVPDYRNTSDSCKSKTLQVKEGFYMAEKSPGQQCLLFRVSSVFCNGSGGTESNCNAGDTGFAGLIPGLGWPPGGGKGNPLQCSCLESSRDRGAWRATVNGVTNTPVYSKHNTFLITPHSRGMHWLPLLPWMNFISPCISFLLLHNKLLQI